MMSASTSTPVLAVEAGTEPVATAATPVIRPMTKKMANSTTLTKTTSMIAAASRAHQLA
jgi:hypothetical protein